MADGRGNKANNPHRSTFLFYLEAAANIHPSAPTALWKFAIKALDGTA